VIFVSRDTARPGVDVIITNFCDFLPIFGEKDGDFLINQCCDHNFVKNWQQFEQIMPIFLLTFSAKIFKNHNIGPKFRADPNCVSRSIARHGAKRKSLSV
jgi:hypothetical protein